MDSSHARDVPYLEPYAERMLSLDMIHHTAHKQTNHTTAPGAIHYVTISSRGATLVLQVGVSSFYYIFNPVGQTLQTAYPTARSRPHGPKAHTLHTLCRGTCHILKLHFLPPQCFHKGVPSESCAPDLQYPSHLLYLMLLSLYCSIRYNHLTL